MAQNPIAFLERVLVHALVAIIEVTPISAVMAVKEGA
jgi:hypothetical protein